MFAPVRSFALMTPLLLLNPAIAAPTPDEAAAAAKPMECAGVTTEALGIASLRVVSAQAAPAAGVLPAACVVRGEVNERVGADGALYGLGFEIRLPRTWNGRFLHQVNGGNDGEIVPAIGDPKNLNAVGGSPALARGFAVLSSDEGHSGADPAKAAFGIAAGAAFGLDPKARQDYGYSGDETLGPIGKAIIARYYGVAPARSYMMGCSNGGRHAMVAASRFPDRYDGFVAGDPGFELPRAAVQHAWDVQSFLPINRDIRKAFSPADMALISRRILDACDALDGVRDGVVADIQACQKVFHLSDLTCASDKTEACLSAQQVQGLTRSVEGPHNSKGEPLYSDWSYDAGMSGSNWLFWKVASGVPAWNGNPLIATMGAASLAMIFTTPPSTPKGDPAGLIGFLASFNFDTDAPKIYATGVSGGINYQQSAWGFMTPPDAEKPTLAGLKAAGGKLIVYHGQSDPVFSFNATARWVEKLDANNGGDAGAFARLFAVPNMNHCSGGPATDSFDALGAIVDWAENGAAPDRIIASVRPENKEVPADWSASRTRPLCPWPTVARYVGPDVEKADSFVCK